LASPVRRRWPALTAAWFAFLAITFPMLGIIQNGPQIAADRYTYHAAPVIAILGAAGLLLWTRTTRAVPLVVGAAILLVLGTLTRTQTKISHDSGALSSHAVRLDGQSPHARVGLANWLAKQDRGQEAIGQY